MKKNPALDHPASLEHHMLAECTAMVKFALASGKNVPPLLVQDLTALDRVCRQSAPAADDLPEQTAVADATAAPSDLAKRLALYHSQLSRIVTPAKPGALLLLAREAADGGLKQYLGPVPLIRRMMLVAILSLVALVAVSLSPEVNGAPDSFSLLKSYGMKLFLNEIFLLTSAGIGASFYALFKANQYIQQGTYDPRYEASYWIRFVLGLMAGMIIATMIPIGDVGSTGSTLGTTNLQGLEKPILAMLGGFSASVVYRILNRLVAAVESIVQGDAKDMLAAREEEAKVRLAEQSLESRLRLAARLNQLQQQFHMDGDMTELLEELGKVQESLFAYDGLRDDEPAKEDASQPVSAS